MDWLDWTDWLLDLLRNGITSQPCTYTLASSIFHIPVDSSYLIVSSRSGSRVGSCGTPIHSARLSFDVWCTHSAGETISSAEHRLRDLGKNMTFDNKPLPEVWRLSPYEGRQLRPRQIMGIVPYNTWIPRTDGYEQDCTQIALNGLQSLPSPTQHLGASSLVVLIYHLPSFDIRSILYHFCV